MTLAVFLTGRIEQRNAASQAASIVDKPESLASVRASLPN